MCNFEHTKLSPEKSVSLLVLQFISKNVIYSEHRQFTPNFFLGTSLNFQQIPPKVWPFRPLVNDNMVSLPWGRVDHASEYCGHICNSLVRRELDLHQLNHLPLFDPACLDSDFGRFSFFSHLSRVLVSEV